MGDAGETAGDIGSGRGWGGKGRGLILASIEDKAEAEAQKIVVANRSRSVHFSHGLRS